MTLNLGGACFKKRKVELSWSLILLMSQSHKKKKNIDHVNDVGLIRKAGKYNIEMKEAIEYLIC